MQITLKFRDTDARTVTYYLQRRYNSKAKLEKLAMVAIRREVSNEAEKELEELGKGSWQEVKESICNNWDSCEPCSYAGGYSLTHGGRECTHPLCPHNENRNNVVNY